MHANIINNVEILIKKTRCKYTDFLMFYHQGEKKTANPAIKTI